MASSRLLFHTSRVISRTDSGGIVQASFVEDVELGDFVWSSGLVPATFATFDLSQQIILQSRIYAYRHSGIGIWGSQLRFQVQLYNCVRCRTVRPSSMKP